MRGRDLFRDIAKVSGRVDELESRVGDIEDTTKEDAKTLRLQQQGMTLLQRLAANHEARISRTEAGLARVRRRIAERSRR